MNVDILDAILDFLARRLIESKEMINYGAGHAVYVIVEGNHKYEMDMNDFGNGRTVYVDNVAIGTYIG